MNNEIIKNILKKHNINGKNLNDLFLKNLNKFSLSELKMFLKSIGANISGKKEKLIKKINEWNKNKKLIYSFFFIISIIGLLSKNIIKRKFLRLAMSLNDKILESLINIYFNEKGFEKIKKTLKLFFNSEGIDIVIGFLKDLYMKDDSFSETIILINQIMTEREIPYSERIKYTKKIILLFIKNKNNPLNIFEEISDDPEIFSFLKKIFI